MSKLEIPSTLRAQLSNIKGFQDSSDEAYAIIEATCNQYTLYYLSAMLEELRSEFSGDDLINAIITLIGTVEIAIKKEEIWKRLDSQESK